VYLTHDVVLLLLCCSDCKVCGAFELLRPNVKDILYTLEVNTFKVRT
jgi:hypothetical protein